MLVIITVSGKENLNFFLAVIDYTPHYLILSIQLSARPCHVNDELRAVILKIWKRTRVERLDRAVPSSASKITYRLQ